MKRFAILLSCVFSALLFSGCGDGVGSGYKVFDHDAAKCQTVVVLPFLDARTLRDKNDPLNDTAAAKAREVFVSALNAKEAFREKKVIAPDFERTPFSFTLKQCLEYGRQNQADLVIAGQVFAFVETRAASIPPKAGLFVRIFSVPEKRMVFVGAHFLSGSCGREALVREVTSSILDLYVKGEAEGGALKAEVTKKPEASAPKVLFLPYNELITHRNFIPHTGGGAVSGSLYEMEMGKAGMAELLESDDEAGYEKLLTVEEALALGRKMKVDYVVRGQVVEFRRAMSAPSWASAIISTAILAAQILFAEQSGVDIATEVWRVKDGECVFARRDISVQKYVVQAETTVRRLAEAASADMLQAMTPDASPVAPVIDTIVIPAPPAVKPAKEEEKKPEPAAEQAKPEEKKETPVEEKKPDPAAEQDKPEEKKDAPVEEKAVEKKEAPVAEKKPEPAAEQAKPEEKKDAPVEEKKPAEVAKPEVKVEDAKAAPEKTEPQKPAKEETPVEPKAEPAPEKTEAENVVGENPDHLAAAAEIQAQEQGGDAQNQDDKVKVGMGAED
jgi:hypothetical protein